MTGRTMANYIAVNSRAGKYNCKWVYTNSHYSYCLFKTAFVEETVLNKIVLG